MLKLEVEILKSTDAKNDPMSFNKHNGDGIFAWVGDKNPMKNPEIAKRVGESHSGEKHWTKNLNGKEHPQKGRLRPEISGNNHPNKKPENAKKISDALTGVPKSPEHVQKMREVHHLSGEDHWMNNPAHNKTCEYCDIVCSNTNYTRWHGIKCKKRNIL